MGFVIFAIIGSIRSSASVGHLPLLGISRISCAVVTAIDEDAYIEIVLPITIGSILEYVSLSEPRMNVPL